MLPISTKMVSSEGVGRCVGILAFPGSSKMTQQTNPQPIVIVLGTRNRKKRDEMAELVTGQPGFQTLSARVLIHALDEYPESIDVVEDAPTFAGNARKKACEQAARLGRFVLADDSGLEVDALGGAPGVLSARYAGEPCDDAANNRKLLDALANVPDADRGAGFRCCLCLADPTGQPRIEVEAACRGRIAHAIHGAGGFGYDPLFIIREYHRTFGELSTLVKHHLSHRARAFGLLRPKLQMLIASGSMDA